MFRFWSNSEQDWQSSPATVEVNRKYRQKVLDSQ
jgi:hypothetical protein